MPGMMDTVLNLGLNEETVTGWRNRPVIYASPSMLIVASLRCSERS